MKLQGKYLLYVLALMLCVNPAFSQAPHLSDLRWIDSTQQWAGYYRISNYSERGSKIFRTSIVVASSDTLFLNGPDDKIFSRRGTMVFDEIDTSTHQIKRLRTHDVPDSFYLDRATFNPRRDYCVVEYRKIGNPYVPPAPGSVRTKLLEIYHYDTLLATAEVNFYSEAMRAWQLIVDDQGVIRIIVHSTRNVKVNLTGKKQLEIAGGNAATVDIHARSGVMKQTPLALDSNWNVVNVWLSAEGVMRILTVKREPETIDTKLLYDMQEQSKYRKHYQLLGIANGNQVEWKTNIETTGSAVVNDGVMMNDGRFLLTAQLTGFPYGPASVTAGSTAIECKYMDRSTHVLCFNSGGKLDWATNLQLDRNAFWPEGNMSVDTRTNKVILLCNVSDTAINFRNSFKQDSLKFQLAALQVGLLYLDPATGNLNWTLLIDSARVDKVKYFELLSPDVYGFSGIFLNYRSPVVRYEATNSKREREKLYFGSFKVK